MYLHPEGPILRPLRERSGFGWMQTACGLRYGERSRIETCTSSGLFCPYLSYLYMLYVCTTQEIASTASQATNYALMISDAWHNLNHPRTESG